MREEWYEGLYLAIRALKNISDCAGLFGLTGPLGNKSPGPQSVLAQISRSYSFESIQPTPAGTNLIDVISATTVGTGSGTVPIDNGTILVSAGVKITINNVAGSFATGGPNDWAATILHELGHAYWYLFGAGTSAITPDGPSAPAGVDGIAASQANTALIKRKCKL